jgi:hypothetical protein
MKDVDALRLILVGFAIMSILGMVLCSYGMGLAICQRDWITVAIMLFCVGVNLRNFHFALKRM